MKTVFAIELVTTTPGFADVKSMVGDWVSANYQNWSTTYVPAFASTWDKPIDRHYVYSGAEVLERGNKQVHLLEFDWSHPGSPDDTHRWRTSITVATKGDVLEISCTVRVGSETFMVKPLYGYTVGTPRLVRDLLARFDCRIGEWPVPRNPTTVNREGVGSFLAEVLENPARTLPVLLVSHDAWSSKPLISTRQLARKTLGLAQVVEIDKFAGFELSAQVGKILSCYNGAVRVYWPGFMRGDKGSRHWLYKPDRLREIENRGHDLSQYVYNYVSRVAASRFREGSLAAELRRSVQATRREQLKDLKQRLEESVDQGTWKEIEEILDSNARLENENDDLRNRVSELELELEGHKENWDSYQQYLMAEEDQHRSSGSEQTETIEFSSVVEAVRRAAEDFSVRLEVLPSALKSSDESAFSRPHEVYEALRAIDQLCATYSDSLDRGESMGTWEDFFAQSGVKYAPTEHQNTLTMYGKHREFMHDGRKRQILKHLTIGGGDRTNCVQIYFDPDSEARRMLIAYVGPHLPYYGQKT